MIRQPPKPTLFPSTTLSRSGEAILRHARYGGKVIGLCGGMQMLGRCIHDPLGVEGTPGSSPGLALLDFETTLEPPKQIGRAHVWTPVTATSRMPSSAC